MPTPADPPRAIGQCCVCGWADGEREHQSHHSLRKALVADDEAPRTPPRLAIDVRQDLATLLVKPEGCGRKLEADVVEVPKQIVPVVHHPVCRRTVSPTR